MKVFACLEKKSLVYLNKGSGPEYWDEHWDKIKVLDPLKTSKSFVDITRKYLSCGSCIVEGGCGLGDKAWGLSNAGYKVSAVDFACQTLSRVKSQYPELDVINADVRNMPFSDHSQDGYWSIGVIEHFWGGYDEILKEAYRVLKPGGYLFLTFPSMSLLRRVRVFMKSYPVLDYQKEIEPIGFYQFILEPYEVKTKLRNIGFKLIKKEEKRRSLLKGLHDDWPLAEKMFKAFLKIQHFKGKSMIKRFILKSLTPFCGHSIIIVAKKPN